VSPDHGEHWWDMVSTPSLDSTNLGQKSGPLVLMALTLSAAAYGAFVSKHPRRSRGIAETECIGEFVPLRIFESRYAPGPPDSTVGPDQGHFRNALIVVRSAEVSASNAEAELRLWLGTALV
jgi:hypothetical protein